MSNWDIEELVQLYSGRIYGLALRLTGNQADAEDVLQETFLTVMQKLHTFEGRSNIYTWIHRIAANHALGKLRRLKRTGEVEISQQDFENLSAFNPSQPFLPGISEQDSEDVRQAIDKAVTELPESQRVVFLLRDVEGYSTAEAAQALKISNSNVKIRLMRARINLRNRLSHFHQPGGAA